MKMRRVTYKPLKNNRYRVVINGVEQMGKENLWTQKQVLQHGLRLLEQGHTLRIGRSSGKTTPPKKTPTSRHQSPYRAKQHRSK